MRQWQDTANIDEIKTAVSWGVMWGVTTNPSLVAKEGFKVPFKKVGKMIAASARNPIHVIEAAKAGAHVATIPFGVLEQMLKHPLTDIGIQRFSDDWKKSGISFG